MTDARVTRSSGRIREQRIVVGLLLRFGHVARRGVLPALVLLVAQLGTAALSSSEPQALSFAPRTGHLWQPYQQWSIAGPDFVGNPFDVVATATFVHDVTGDVHRTPMFFSGDASWSFRFTGTSTGEWSFTTHSDFAALDGWTGTVQVESGAEPSARGFLTSVGTRFAVPVTEEGALAARQLNVYMHPAMRDTLLAPSLGPEAFAQQVDGMLDDVEAHGFDALLVVANNNWFALGADAYRDHESVNPSLAFFENLERLLLRAYARGVGLHIWAWGDEERGWTPVGVGGINGTPDRRLQRYIAARLGPLPGWTMSYGFDLDEWVTPAQVRAWHAYLHEQLGWPHLLMARETPSDFDPASGDFRFDGRPLDVRSVDERPKSGFFEAAATTLASADVPVMFERRFVYLRDGVWDMDTTRRAMWQFTLAGGAGAIWGPEWGTGRPYPAPEQLKTHQTFWRDRWTFGLKHGTRPSEAPAPLVMRDDGAQQTIIYAESASAVRIDLSRMVGMHPAVAVDTVAPYAEIQIGPLSSGETVWQAPYASDWVVAVGTF